MRTNRPWILGLVLAAAAAASAPALAGEGHPPAALDLKARAAVFDRWLRVRLDTVLPEIMRRENVDLWVVVCREYNEDPVYLTMVPLSSMSARRLSILVFYDSGQGPIERLSVSRYGIGDFYKALYEPGKADQWDVLAGLIKDKNPRKIAVDESAIFAFGDGLSSTHKAKLVQALGPDLSRRLVSAERLAVGWLERRTSDEIEVYPQIVGIAHAIIAEAFSRAVITPGVTTTDEVVWFMRERIAGLKLGTWFQPSVSVQRPKSSPLKETEVIHRGDMLHCDMGISYLGLNTDTQELAYVLGEGEDEAPAGLRNGLALGNRLQEILIGEFREGRSGNDILAAALKKAKGEGLRPSIYTHPLGFHGHAAGPTIGLWDMQGGVPGAGDYPLFADTVHSIELNVVAAVPEWGNQDVQFALEEDAVFTRSGTRFIDGRQTKLILIK
jgi:Xaa-Pro aminopeptidase